MGIVTGLQAGRPRNRGYIPDRTKRFSVCELSGSRSGVAENAAFFFFRDVMPRHCVTTSRRLETAR